MDTQEMVTPIPVRLLFNQEPVWAWDTKSLDSFCLVSGSEAEVFPGFGLARHWQDKVLKDSDEFISTMATMLQPYCEDALGKKACWVPTQLS